MGINGIPSLGTALLNHRGVNAGDVAEVGIEGQHRSAGPGGTGGDPDIIGGNGGSAAAQIDDDFPINACNLVVH